jgi:parallel beta helix pectate lyase-like protein
MKKLLLPLLVLALWSLNSCQKSDEMTVSTQTRSQQMALKTLPAGFTPTIRCGCSDGVSENLEEESDMPAEDDTRIPEDAVVQDRVNCQHSITIPAGSVDVLAEAIDNVCTGGTIWFASGVHTEHDGVVINKRVNLRGKNGAVLKIQSDILLDFAVPVDVALYFKYATKSTLQNMTIEPVGDIAGLAVLLEKSNGAAVKNCHFNNFQYSVIVQKSTGTKITKNVIVCTDAWLSGAIPESYGIININGEGPEISGNEVSQGLFGIWGCDREGKMEKNYTHHNFVGIIACKVPAGGFTMPNGESAGAKYSATHWVIKNNRSENNFNAGILVIDGANKNHLINNKSLNNGTYGIDLVGDSYRFGFLTPTCYKNAVWAGQYQNVTIKDCGVANLIYGGVQINTEEDPCY